MEPLMRNQPVGNMREISSLANIRPLPPNSSLGTTSIEQTTSQTISRKELMKVTIDLGEDQSEVIVIREGETPEMVSRAFAAKFELPEETEWILRDQIE